MDVMHVGRRQSCELLLDNGNSVWHMMRAVQNRAGQGRAGEGRAGQDQTAGAQSDTTHRGKAGQQGTGQGSREQGRAAGDRAGPRAGPGQAGTRQDGHCRAELSRG